MRTVLLAIFLGIPLLAQVMLPARKATVRPIAGTLCETALFTNGLVSCWTLDEPSLSNRVDSVGTNDLTSDAALATNGVISNAAYFNTGVDQKLYRTDADAPSLSPGDTDFTVTAWAMLLATNTTENILFKASPSNWEYMIAYLSAPNRVYWRVSSDGSSVSDLGATNATNPGLGVWHFYVAWHDAAANTIGIQVDDGVANTMAHASGVYSAGNAPFVIGGPFTAGGAASNSRVDEVKYHSRLLTAEEKTALYNAGAGVTCCE